MRKKSCPAFDAMKLKPRLIQRRGQNCKSMLHPTTLQEAPDFGYK